MTETNWRILARIDYETGKFTLAQIAIKYGKSDSSVRKIAANCLWQKNNTALKEKKKIIIKQEVKKKETAEIKEKKETIEEKQDKLVKACLDEVEPILRRQVQQELSNNDRILDVVNKLLLRAEELIDNDLRPQDFKSITSALSDIQKIHRVAENLDGDTSLKNGEVVPFKKIFITDSQKKAVDEHIKLTLGEQC